MEYGGTKALNAECLAAKTYANAPQTLFPYLHSILLTSHFPSWIAEAQPLVRRQRRMVKGMLCPAFSSSDVLDALISFPPQALHSCVVGTLATGALRLSRC